MFDIKVEQNEKTGDNYTVNLLGMAKALGFFCIQSLPESSDSTLTVVPGEIKDPLLEQCVQFPPPLSDGRLCLCL